MNQAGPCALLSRSAEGPPTMRVGLIVAASALILWSFPATASARCDDKSQQNAAGEAVVKSDLAPGSSCADPSGQARSEQKNEDAAARANRETEEKSGTDGRSGTSARPDRRENPPARPGER
jgi:hypothetical protein